LSLAENRGCGSFRLKTPSCCRRARFSKNRLRRERKDRVKRTNKSLNERGIRTLYQMSRHCMMNQR
jgi:hypothetical protein